MSFQHMLLGSFIAATVAVSTGHTATVTFTMDEVANQPINGLTVTKGGISVTYSDPTGGLLYNSFGPGNTVYVQDPSIQGSSSSFSASFSQLVTGIAFGFAQNTSSNLNVNVNLSNGTTLNLSLSPLISFSEGLFSYTGAPVSGFTVTPVSGLLLAFDNLSLTFAAAAVPEPASMALLGAGLLGIGWACRKRACWREPRQR